MRLLDRYLGNSDDPALRREVSEHIRTVLHDAVDILGPKFNKYGLGLAKSRDGTFMLHAWLRKRTKKLRSALDIHLDGFHPERWPAQGSVPLVLRLTSYAGGTVTKSYVYETTDVDALASVAMLFAADGYVVASPANAPQTGSTRGTLCEKTIDITAATMFEDGAPTVFAQLLATEHERIAEVVRKWLRSAAN